MGIGSHGWMDFRFTQRYFHKPLQIPYQAMHAVVTNAPKHGQYTSSIQPVRKGQLTVRPNYQGQGEKITNSYYSTGNTLKSLK